MLVCPSAVWPRICLYSSPRCAMSVLIGRGKPKRYIKHFFHCQFCHQKSHVEYPGFEPGERQRLPVRTMAWYSAFPSWNVYLGFDPQNGRDFSLRHRVRTKPEYPSRFLCSRNNGPEKARALTWKFVRCLCWDLKLVYMGRISQAEGRLISRYFFVRWKALPCVMNIPLIVRPVILFSARNISSLDVCVFTLCSRFPYFLLQVIHFSFTKPTLLMNVMTVPSSITYVR
jgi:hypothetical protein